MGMPALPRGTPAARFRFLALREKLGQDDLDPGDEREVEWYFIDTGQTVESNVPEGRFFWDESGPRPGDPGYEAHVKGGYFFHFGLEKFREKFGEEPSQEVLRVAAALEALGDEFPASPPDAP